MPPSRAAVVTDQDQSRNSERQVTRRRRAASLPAVRRENPRLESLRLRTQSSFLDVEGTPSPSLQTKVIDDDEGPRPTRPVAAARGHKRERSPRGTPQTNTTASTSTSVAEPITDGEKRPRKRRRKSLLPSAEASSSQLTVQSQSRRRTRSRAGSPLTDVEGAKSSRISARLTALRTPSFVNLGSSDIYTHLADPDSPGHLLSQPFPRSTTQSIPKDASRLQPIKRPRGRPRKIRDLGDEVTKRNLMEEWVQLRQSQGALPLSGIDQNACPSRLLFRGAQSGGESVSSTQLEPTVTRSLPNSNSVESQATTTASTSRSDEMVKVSSNGSLTSMDLGNSSRVPYAFQDKVGADDLAPPAGKFDLTVLGQGVEVASTSVNNPRVDADLPGDELNHEILQRPSIEDPIHIRRVSPVTEQAESLNMNDASTDIHLMNVSQTSSSGSGTIHLDFEEEFYMLDIPEIFTLPWVPASSHLYVPPGLGKLISGMREQLIMATRARRRAEELYQAELSRRISAEKAVEELRTKLEEGREDSVGGTISARRRASSIPS